MTARPIVPPYLLDKARLSANVEVQVRDACSSTNYKQAFIMSNVEDFIHTETVRAGRKLRRVYDAQHSDQLNFRSHRLVRREEDGPTGDRSVNDAFDNGGRVFDFYFQEHQWKSLDNKFMPITSVVHFDVDYVNAFWLPSKQAMYYGDGMAGLMTNFVGCLDVVGHEMTHAVIDKLSPLEYLNQSGALNESIADVFGIMIKQKRDNQDALTSDWMLGKEIMDPSLNALGLRSMKNPGTAYNNPILGKDPQPDHMSRFVNTTDDQGGVHINSGIPNRAFYLFASKVGGNAWTNAGPVWFNALRLGQGGRLPYNAEFVDWARLTLDAAQDWKGPQLRQILKSCWTDVGVNVQ